MVQGEGTAELWGKREVWLDWREGGGYGMRWADDTESKPG